MAFNPFAPFQRGLDYLGDQIGLQTGRERQEREEGVRQMLEQRYQDALRRQRGTPTRSTLGSLNGNRFRGAQADLVRQLRDQIEGGQMGPAETAARQAAADTRSEIVASTSGARGLGANVAQLGAQRAQGQVQRQSLPAIAAAAGQDRQVAMGQLAQLVGQARAQDIEFALRKMGLDDAAVADALAAYVQLEMNSANRPTIEEVGMQTIATSL